MQRKNATAGSAVAFSYAQEGLPAFPPVSRFFLMMRRLREATEQY